MDPVRGTYDLYDKEMLIHSEIVETLKYIAKNFDYSEIKTPIIEKSNLYNHSTGDSSDIVQKEMYTFLDKGNRELALRPELTAGVVRSFISNKIYGKRDPQYKYFYYGEAFRYERPQKGRYRQFYQFGVEFFGDNSEYADVETIALANSIISKLNLDSKIVLKVNSIGSSSEREEFNKLLRKYFSKYEDDLCTDCKTRLELNPMRILDCKIDSKKDFFKNAPTLKQSLTPDSIDRFVTVLNLLDDMDIKYVEDETLVRGLDYYNDLVFEFVYDNTYTLIGGGRYDSLVKEMDGPQTPAIGFGLGIERVIEAFKTENQELLDEFSNKVDIVYGGLIPQAFPIIIKSMTNLRNAGLVCSCLFEKSNLKTILKHANKVEAVYLVIIGEEELKNKEIKVKNLITGDEETKTLESFEVDIIKKDY